MIAKPTEALLSGELDKPIYVLTLPEIRNAEQRSSHSNCQTADGEVQNRPEDIVMTAYGGEQYPIKREVFLGAYKVIGQVGNYLVADRLIHVRRAWPILSANAVYDYGSDRGRVSTARGGWLYQSDDDDFGLINRDVKLKSHLIVGLEAQVTGNPWARRYSFWTAALAALPPLLSLLALIAFSASANGYQGFLVDVLLVAETLLLTAGVVLVYWMKQNRWLLKACVASGLELSRRFQIAVTLLGQPASVDFPGMALWRSAQLTFTKEDDKSEVNNAAFALHEGSLHAEIATTLENLHEKIHQCRNRELMTSTGTITVICLILLINIYILFVAHHIAAELFAIWLPALVSAVHAFNFRRRTTDRIGAMCEFVSQLKFIQVRLFGEESNNTPSNFRVANHVANIQLLCRFVAEFNQRELRFALAGEQSFSV